MQCFLTESSWQKVDVPWRRVVGCSVRQMCGWSLDTPLIVVRGPRACASVGVCMSTRHRDREGSGARARSMCSCVPPIGHAQGVVKDRDCKLIKQYAGNVFKACVRTKKRPLSVETFKHTRADVIIKRWRDGLLFYFVCLLQMLNNTKTAFIRALVCSPHHSLLELHNPCAMFCFSTYSCLCGQTYFRDLQYIQMNQFCVASVLKIWNIRLLDEIRASHILIPSHSYST